MCPTGPKIPLFVAGKRFLGENQLLEVVYQISDFSTV
jgi:hypothetical protein